MAVKNYNPTLKSSVYQPVGSTLFGQLTTEQHMNHHYRLVDNAKATIDNKIPKSYKREVKRRNTSSVCNSKSSRPSSRLSQLSSMKSSCGSSSFSIQDDIVVRNAMGIRDKRHVTDPLTGLNVRDKVALYVNIMQPKIEEYDKYHQPKKDHHLAPSSIASSSVRNNHKKNGDLLDSRVFTKPVTSFVPRINANNKATPSLTRYRYYNPPIKKHALKKEKKRNPSSGHSSCTNDGSFCHKRWLNEQAKKATARQRAFKNFPNATPDSAYNGSFKTISRDELNSIGFNGKENISKTHWNDEKEEMRYLEFIFDITEDIISRGIFTNRVLKQVLKSQMLRRKNELDMSKMSMLIDQLREDLGIPSGGEMDELEAGLGSTSDVLNKPTSVLEMFSVGDVSPDAGSVHKDSDDEFSMGKSDDSRQSEEPSQDTLKKLKKLSLGCESEDNIKLPTLERHATLQESHFRSEVQFSKNSDVSSDTANSFKDLPSDRKNESTEVDSQSSQNSDASDEKSDQSPSSSNEKSDQSPSSSNVSNLSSHVSEFSRNFDLNADDTYADADSFDSDSENS